MGKLEAALRSLSKGGGKKGKGGGKKGKDAGGAAGLSVLTVQEAIAKAEPRPSFEAEWLAADLVRRAREAILAAGDPEGVLRQMAADEAPLEPILEALPHSLVQRTSSRV